MLMIFNLLTSPKGHQFDPRLKMLLAFCSACHPRRFDMLHDHHIIIIGFLINMQVQGHHPHQWAPFQVTG